MKSYRTIIIAIVLIIILVLIVKASRKDTSLVPDAQTTDNQSIIIPVSIRTEPITQDNYTGTRLVVEGSSSAAKAAQAYVDKEIADFQESANEQVPDMKAQFGADSPSSNYTIDFKGKYIESDTTESVVINEYLYTGGANGMSVYKVFTASRTDNNLLSLSSMIKPTQKDAFTAYVKKQLVVWRPEGAEGLVVFEEDVNTLTFDSFTDWSLDGNNLTLYFSKYAIGPGALGPVAFPIPRTSLQTFLVN